MRGDLQTVDSAERISYLRRGFVLCDPGSMFVARHCADLTGQWIHVGSTYGADSDVRYGIVGDTPVYEYAIVPSSPSPTQKRSSRTIVVPQNGEKVNEASSAERDEALELSYHNRVWASGVATYGSGNATTALRYYSELVDELIQPDDSSVLRTGPQRHERNLSVQSIFSVISDAGTTSVIAVAAAISRAAADAMEESNASVAGRRMSLTVPDNRGWTSILNLAVYAAAAKSDSLRQRFAATLQAVSSQHDTYDAIYASWISSSVLKQPLQDLHSTHLRGAESQRLSPESAFSLVQPNPFGSEVATSSKLYLTLALAVFRASLRSGKAFVGCGAIADELGVQWIVGPLKRGRRIVEKAFKRNGRFDKVFDYVRGSFIVDNLSDLEKVVAALFRSNVLEVVRAKNRFHEQYDASTTCGYRDYQALVRGADGWISEIQVIPRSLFNIRAVLATASVSTVPGLKLTGDMAYKEYCTVSWVKRLIQEHPLAEDMREEGPYDTPPETAYDIVDGS